MRALQQNNVISVINGGVQYKGSEDERRPPATDVDRDLNRRH